MLHRTPAHHPHTIGLLPAALEQPLPHIDPPHTPTNENSKETETSSFGEAELCHVLTGCD